MSAGTGSASTMRCDVVAARLIEPLERLESVLEAERSALTSGDFVALGEHVQHKRGLLRELERSMSSFAAPGPDEAVSAEWTQLLARLNRCHVLNQSIGAAVTSQLRHNDQLLRILGHASESPGYAPTHAKAGAVSGRGRALGTC